MAVNLINKEATARMQEMSLATYRTMDRLLEKEAAAGANETILKERAELLRKHDNVNFDMHTPGERFKKKLHNRWLGYRQPKKSLGDAYSQWEQFKKDANAETAQRMASAEYYLNQNLGYFPVDPLTLAPEAYAFAYPDQVLISDFATCVKKSHYTGQIKLYKSVDNIMTLAEYRGFTYDQLAELLTQFINEYLPQFAVVIDTIKGASERFTGIVNLMSHQTMRRTVIASLLRVTRSPDQDIGSVGLQIKGILTELVELDQIPVRDDDQEKTLDKEVSQLIKYLIAPNCMKELRKWIRERKLKFRIDSSLDEKYEAISNFEQTREDCKLTQTVGLNSADFSYSIFNTALELREDGTIGSDMLPDIGTVECDEVLDNFELFNLQSEAEVMEPEVFMTASGRELFQYEDAYVFYGDDNQLVYATDDDLSKAVAVRALQPPTAPPPERENSSRYGAAPARRGLRSAGTPFGGFKSTHRWGNEFPISPRGRGRATARAGPRPLPPRPVIPQPGGVRYNDYGGQPKTSSVPVRAGPQFGASNLAPSVSSGGYNRIDYSKFPNRGAFGAQGQSPYPSSASSVASPVQEIMNNLQVNKEASRPRSPSLDGQPRRPSASPSAGRRTMTKVINGRRVRLAHSPRSNRWVLKSRVRGKTASCQLCGQSCKRAGAGCATYGKIPISKDKCKSCLAKGISAFHNEAICVSTPSLVRQNTAAATSIFNTDEVELAISDADIGNESGEELFLGEDFLM